IAGGTGWSKNGIGKSRRSRSRASTPSRFFRCCRIQCAGLSEKRPSRVLPTMTEMTGMILLLAWFWYQTVTWTKLDTDPISARTHRPDTRAHADDRPASSRPEPRGLPRRQLHPGAGRRQVDRADRRPAGRWAEALQRDQADGRRHFPADAHLHAARIGARRTGDANCLPDHAAAGGLRIDQARQHLVAGRGTARFMGARACGGDPHVAGTVRREEG